MPRRFPPLVHPLDDPPAMVVAGVLLVVLVRLTPLGLPLALLVGVAAAFTVAALRGGYRSRGEGVRDRRVSAGIEAALERSRQLAIQAEGVSLEAMARLQDPVHLESLGRVQLCCERLRGMPDRIQQRRPLLESGGGVLLSVEDLNDRLAREQEALRREGSSTLRRERQQLVDQLERNLEAARLGMDEREARLLALSTRLERIDGGLRRLVGQVDRQWPSSEAGDAAMAEAIAPLDEALDQIERLLDAGQR